MPDTPRILRSVRMEKVPFEVDPGVSGGKSRTPLTSELAREEAQRILARARLEAEQIRRSTASDVAAMRASVEDEVQKAVQEGREQGYAEGQQVAFQEIANEFAGQIQELMNLVEGVREERVRNLRSQEQEILRLAVAVAEHVVRMHVKVEPDTVAHIANAAVERATEREEITLLVNPDDIAALEVHVPDIRNRFKSIRKITIQEDARISRGGCIVESAGGYVDGTIERQLSEMLKELGIDV